LREGGSNVNTRQRTIQTVRRWTLVSAAALVVAGAALTAALPARAESLNNLRVNKRRIDFGPVVVDKEFGRKSVEVTNAGVDPLQVTVVDASAPFSTLARNFTLQSGQSSEVIVRFDPRYPMISEGVLTITSDDLNHPEVRVKLVGIGVGDAALPSIAGTWTTPQGDGIRFEQSKWDDRPIVVTGRFIGSLEQFDLDPSTDVGAFPFAISGWFDGGRFVGTWELTVGENRFDSGDVEFRLTLDDTLVGRFDFGGFIWELTLTRRLTHFSGWWVASDGTRFYLEHGPTSFNGTFGTTGPRPAQGRIYDGRFEGWRVKCSFEASVFSLKDPLRGMLEVYQIATGKLRCWLVYEGKDPMELTLEKES
jgi:hypothetical protein